MKFLNSVKKIFFKKKRSPFIDTEILQIEGMDAFFGFDQTEERKKCKLFHNNRFTATPHLYIFNI